MRRLLAALPLVLVLFALPATADNLAAAYTALRLGDFRQAFGLFQQAAEEGSARAQLQLGKLYLAGRGHPQDRALGLHWLEAAAQQDDPGAQYTLGVALLEDARTERGLYWLEAASKAGHPGADKAIQAAAEFAADGADSHRAPLLQRWQAAGAACSEQELAGLLRAGADVNWLDDYQRNALHYQVVCDNQAAAELLLRREVDPLQKDSFGDSPLSLAVSRNAGALLQAILASSTVQLGKLPQADALVHLAIARHAREALAVLLQHGANPDAHNSQGDSALDIADRLGAKDLQTLLRDAGGEHNSTGRDITAAVAHLEDHPERDAVWQAARQAAIQDEPQVLQALVDRYGNGLLSVVDEGGRSLLMYAAQAGATDALEVLLNAGAQANQRNDQGTTALMRAAKYGRTSAVRFLLQAGANPTVANAAGETALHIALQEAHDETALAILTDTSRRKPLARGEYLTTAVRRGAGRSAQWLLQHGADPDVRDKLGRTALWHAVDNCDSALADALAKAGANARIADDAGATPLHRACESGCAAAVGGLLRAGADIQAVTPRGNTPLMLAARNTRTGIALALLSDGAQVDTINAAGDSALTLAVSADNAALVAELLNRGADSYRRNELGESAASIARTRSEPVQALLEKQNPLRLPFSN